jgi:predicted  nucleic acid-binding Zn-ribbon protein
MPDVVSPAEELAQLKQDLEGKQSDTSRLAKEVDQLKARIADLSKTVGDIDQKTSAYEKAAGAAGDQLKNLKAYVDTEKTMLKAALEPSSITDIEGKKNAALQKLADLKTGLSAATKKATDADTAYSEAKDATAAAQAAYKAIADLPAANADVIKDLAGLRPAADKQGAANSLGRQYLLVLVMEDRLKAIKTLTPEEYKKELNNAGSALAEASNAHSTAKDELDAAVAAQKQMQKDLDDATAKWRQETLDSIPATPVPVSKAPSPS